MEIAGELARLGAPAGATVLASSQSSGRGRTGRAWTAPPGSSILMSFIAYPLRDRTELGALSLLFGLAVADTVGTFGAGPTAIKWPNDVLVNGRKIAGILVTTRVRQGCRRPTLITGIGLNVNTQASDLPEQATSIAIEAGPQPLDEVLVVLCGLLTSTLRLFDQGAEEELRRRLEAQLAYKDEMVTIEDGLTTVTGLFRGVAANGALILESATGEFVRVVAGDLTRGPRPLGLPPAT